MQTLLSLTLAFFLWIIPMIHSTQAAIAFPLMDDSKITINTSDLIYQGEDSSKTDHPDLGVRLKGENFDISPAKPQEFVNPSNFDNKILEKVWKQFQAASAFLDSDRRSGL